MRSSELLAATADLANRGEDEKEKATLRRLSHMKSFPRGYSNADAAALLAALLTPARGSAGVSTARLLAASNLLRQRSVSFQARQLRAVLPHVVQALGTCADVLAVDVQRPAVAHITAAARAAGYIFMEHGDRISEFLADVLGTLVPHASAAVQLLSARTRSTLAGEGTSDTATPLSQLVACAHAALLALGNLAVQSKNAALNTVANAAMDPLLQTVLAAPAAPSSTSTDMSATSRLVAAALRAAVPLANTVAGRDAMRRAAPELIRAAMALSEFGKRQLDAATLPGEGADVLGLGGSTSDGTRSGTDGSGPGSTWASARGGKGGSAVPEWRRARAAEPSEDSDPDVSDASIASTRASPGGAAKHLPVRVRMAALQLLAALAKASPRHTSSSVHLLLPLSQPLHPQPTVRTLAVPAIFDEASKVREAAMHTIAAVTTALPLTKWLPVEALGGAPSPATARRRSAALDRVGAGSTLADRAVGILRNVHVVLARGLAEERPKHAVVRVASLHATAQVLSHTPYSRCPSGLLTTIGFPLAALLTHEPSALPLSVIVAATQCAGTFATVGATHADGIRVLWPALGGSGGGESSPARAGTTAPQPGLLTALVCLSVPEQPLAVRLEVLAALAKAARHYAGALASHWALLAPSLSAAFSDGNATVRANAVRVVESLLRTRAASVSLVDAAASAAQRMALPEPGSPLSDFTMALQDVRVHPGRSVLTLGALMTRVLWRALRDPHAQVRASAALSYSYLLPVDWARLLLCADAVLPSPPTASAPWQAEESAAATAAASELVSRSGAAWRDALLNALFEQCSDSAPTVRAAGVRALGSLAVWREWKSYRFASIAVKRLLRTLQEDSAPAVRTRALWALGNLAVTPAEVRAEESTHAATATGVIAPLAPETGALERATVPSSPARPAPLDMADSRTPERAAGASASGVGSSAGLAASPSSSPAAPHQAPLLLSQFVPNNLLRQLVDMAHSLLTAHEADDKTAPLAARAVGHVVKGLIEFEYPADAWAVANRRVAATSNSGVGGELGSESSPMREGDRVRRLLEAASPDGVVGVDADAFVGAGRVLHQSTAASPFAPRDPPAPVRKQGGGDARPAAAAPALPESQGAAASVRRPALMPMVQDWLDLMALPPGFVPVESSTVPPVDTHYGVESIVADHARVARAVLALAKVIANPAVSAKTRWNAVYAAASVVPRAQILLNAQAKWQRAQPHHAAPADVPVHPPQAWGLPAGWPEAPGPRGARVPDAGAWVKLLVGALVRALVESENYKLRTAAAAALELVPSRKAAGPAWRIVAPRIITSLITMSRAGEDIPRNARAASLAAYLPALQASLRTTTLHWLALSSRTDYTGPVRDVLDAHARWLLTWLAGEVARTELATELGHANALSNPGRWADEPRPALLALWAAVGVECEAEPEGASEPQVSNEPGAEPARRMFLPQDLAEQLAWLGAGPAMPSSAIARCIQAITALYTSRIMGVDPVLVEQWQALSSLAAQVLHEKLPAATTSAQSSPARASV